MSHPTTTSSFLVPGRRTLRIAVCALTALLAYTALPAFSDDEPRDTDYEKGMAADGEKDYELAAKRFLKSAERGNPKAQFKIGVYYRFGQGVKEDHAEAIKWYLKAAEQGHPTAQFNLGAAYFNGEGVVKNEEEAVKWFLKAAESGDDNAQKVVGDLYRYGMYGIEQDPAKAAEWYKKAAARGNSAAQTKLGVMYLNGEGGLKQNDDEAFDLFESALKDKDADAAFYLAELYVHEKGLYNSDFSPVFGIQGVRKRFPGRAYSREQLIKRAAPYYKIAADAGNHEAQFKYFLCTEKDNKDKKYLNAAMDDGHVVAYLYHFFKSHWVDGVSEDVFKSNNVIKAIMETENADPHYVYWTCFLFNYTVKDPSAELIKEINNLYAKAAERGYAPAQDYLGQKYEHGGIDCRFYGPMSPKDEKEAVKWYAKAAEQGYLPAQYHLARCYEKGIGVEENDEESIKWYRKAIDNSINVLYVGIPKDDYYFQDKNHPPYRIGSLKADAAFKLGHYYEKGWGVDKNVDEAVKWYKRATSEKDFYGGFSDDDKEAKEALKRLGKE